MLFSDLHKIMVNKVTFIVFTGGNRPPGSALFFYRSKLIRFGSPYFRDNWGWPCTAVRMWLICSNRKLYKKTIFLLPWQCHHRTNFLVIDSLTIFTAQIFHSHVSWGKVCLHTFGDQNVHRLEKMLANEISRKSNRATSLKFYHGSFTVFTPINGSVI